MFESTWYLKLDCCGVNPVLSKTNDFDQTPWCTTSGFCQTSSSDIPRTCCTGVDKGIYSSAPVSCHGNVTSGTYNEKVFRFMFCFVARERDIYRDLEKERDRNMLIASFNFRDVTKH